MNKKIVVMILMAFLVVACGKRDPEYVGLYNMKIHEMFPQDAQLRALAKAASKGDIQSIDKLVAQGVDVNAVGHRGYTAAMWALYHPNKAGFKRLLEHGTNPNYIMKPSFAKKIRETSLIHETTSRTYSMGVGYLEMILDIGNGDPNLQLPTSKSRPISKATSSTLSQKQAFVLLYNAGAEIDYSDKYDALINSACQDRKSVV